MRNRRGLPNDFMCLRGGTRACSRSSKAGGGRTTMGSSSPSSGHGTLPPSAASMRALAHLASSLGVRRK